ncbi:hypothetical protein QFC20_006996 [Naganishia adeliensis]|uniref:Uncharacterized protein n=1 Tax=Naganishia adeliensis TaxID=92952 RepID=A0ACC2V5T7_9TREE|nr:hypothetical protein QFC20_006996 [Naganishia adeliensis]
MSSVNQPVSRKTPSTLGTGTILVTSVHPFNPSTQAPHILEPAGSISQFNSFEVPEAMCTLGQLTISPSQSSKDGDSTASEWIPIPIKRDQSPADFRKSIESHLRDHENVQVRFDSLSKVITASEPDAVTLRRLLGLPDAKEIEVDSRFAYSYRSTGETVGFLVYATPFLIGAASILAVLGRN